MENNSQQTLFQSKNNIKILKQYPKFNFNQNQIFLIKILFIIYFIFFLCQNVKEILLI